MVDIAKIARVSCGPSACYITDHQGKQTRLDCTGLTEPERAALVAAIQNEINVHHRTQSGCVIT